MTNTNRIQTTETTTCESASIRPQAVAPHRFSPLGLVALATFWACAGCTVWTFDGESDDGDDDQGNERRPREPKGAAIDVHTHLGSPALMKIMTGSDLPGADATELVERLDEARVKRAVVLSGGFFALPDNSNMAPENDWVAGEVARYPERLVGFCGINPLFENAAQEVDRCLALPQMVGVKLSTDGSVLDLTNDEHVAALAAVFDRVEAHDAPVLLHSSDKNGLPLSGDGFANLSTVIAEHPITRVTHAHCAGNMDDDTVDLWLRLGDSGYRENAFIDISACLAYYRDAPLAMRELMVWRLRNWGIDRVLFGSDYFQYGEDETPAETLKTLAQYPFTKKEINTIVNNDASAWLGEIESNQAE